MRRYCLACSTKTGRLIPRVCDALERKRAAKREQSKEERHKTRVRADAAELRRCSVGTMDLRVELAWMVKHFELERTPLVSITRGRAGSRGYAYYGSRKNPGSISLTIGERTPYTSLCAQLWEYLLHEVIHSFGVEHGAEMCAEVDRACLARWGVDVRSGSDGFPTGRVGKEKTYRFDGVAIQAICAAVEKVYTSPPTRAPTLKTKLASNVLRINDRSMSAQEIDAVIIEPIEANPDADAEDKAMVAWLYSCHQHAKKRYVFEVTKENVPHVRAFVRELREWTWDIRMRSCHSWASQLEAMAERVEREVLP